VAGISEREGQQQHGVQEGGMLADMPGWEAGPGLDQSAAIDVTRCLDLDGYGRNAAPPPRRCVHVVVICDWGEQLKLAVGGDQAIECESQFARAAELGLVHA
jgi:hypothetical protein